MKTKLEGTNHLQEISNEPQWTRKNSKGSLQELKASDFIDQGWVIPPSLHIVGVGNLRIGYEDKVSQQISYRYEAHAKPSQSNPEY